MAEMLMIFVGGMFIGFGLAVVLFAWWAHNNDRDDFI